MFLIYHQGRLHRIYDIKYKYVPSMYDNVAVTTLMWSSKNHHRVHHYRGELTLRNLIKNNIFIGTVQECKYLPVWITNSFDYIYFINYNNYLDFYNTDEIDVVSVLDKIIQEIL